MSSYSLLEEAGPDRVLSLQLEQCKAMNAHLLKPLQRPTKSFYFEFYWCYEHAHGQSLHLRWQLTETEINCTTFTLSC